MLTDALKNLGKNLLQKAFPKVYESSSKLRAISNPTAPLSNDKNKPPLIKAVESLQNTVKDSNLIASNTLEAILLQNDILGKIQAGGGMGGGEASAGILDWIKKFMPTSVGNAVGVGAEIIGGGVAIKKLSGAVRGKNGRYMSAKQAAANPEAVAVDAAKATAKPSIAGRNFGRFARGGGKLMRLGPVFSGIMSAIDEYGESGDAYKAGAVGVGSGAGAFGGAALGAGIGQVLIPVPVLGALIGGMVGGWAGSYLGGKAVGTGYDLMSSSSGSPGGSIEAQIIHYKAGDILTLKAQEIIISALEIQGLGQSPAGKSTPVFRQGIGGNAEQRARRERTGRPGGAGEGGSRVSGGSKIGETVDVSKLPVPGTKGAGKYNLYSGTGADPRGDFAKENIVPVETPYGVINVNKNSAAAFKGYFDELHKEGAPLKTLGSYSLRHKQSAGPGHNPGEGWSEHSFGNAIDMDNTTSLSPAMQKWIAENPERFESVKKKWGMKQGIKGDLPHTEFGGVLSPEAREQLEKERSKDESTPSQPTPKDESTPSQPSTEGSKPQEAPPPQPQPQQGPVSYDVDYKKAIQRIRTKYPASSFVSDDYIKTKMAEELKKSNPNLKLEGSRITGDSSEMAKLRQGLQDNLGEDPSNYLKPVEEQPKAIPVPVQTGSPELQRLRAEREKLRKDLKKAKQDKKKDEDHDDKDPGEHKDEPVKDNTRSDRAVWNINPQLHKDEHPQ
jgi:hypothetical protein